MNTSSEPTVSIPSIVDGELFFKMKSCTGNKLSAICIKCNAVICSAGNSSNFVTHLKRLHQDQLPKYEIYKANIKSFKSRKRKYGENYYNYEQECKPPLALIQSTSYDYENNQPQLQYQLDENILNYIVDSMKPLSTVDDLGFRRIIQGLNPEVEVMSSSILTEKIHEKFESVTEEVSAALNNAEYVCVTADLWSTKQKSFLGSTAHYIDETNFQRKSVVLACSRFKGTHCFDKIAQAIYDITESYSLRGSKLVSTVTDNGSNFLKVFKSFGITLRSSNANILSYDDREEERNTEEEELNFFPVSESVLALFLPKQVPCGTHTLSLVATTDFINGLKDCPSVSIAHHTTMEKCSILWNASRKPIPSEIIAETFQSSLIVPCATRWNSLYDAVKQLLQHKERLNEVLERLNLPQFKKYEIDYLDQYCVVMRPIATAMEKLNENDCYYGMYMPTIISVHQQLVQLLNLKADLDQIISLVGRLKEAYEKRFKEFLDLSSTVNCAIIASCSHPNFKMRWVPRDKREAVRSLIVWAMKDVHTLVGENNTQNAGSCEGDFPFDLNNEEDCKYTEKSLGDIEIELSGYLNTKEKDLSVLNNFPLLKKVFLKYNTTLCSSAPVERLFSFAQFLDSPKGACMSDENLKRVAFLKGNSSYNL